MIQKNNGKYDLVCDACGDTRTFLAYDELMEYFIDNKWRTERDTTEKWDICTDCQQKVCLN